MDEQDGRHVRRREVGRVCFLALESRASAATRAHCELPAQLLRDRGLRVDVMTPPAGSAAVSFSDRSRSAKATYAALIVLPRVVVNVLRAARADVVVVQRAIFRYDTPPVLETALKWWQRSRGRWLVLNLDDALYTVRPAAYHRRILLADLVSTGSRDIAAFVESLGRPAFCYPGALRVSRYEVKQVDLNNVKGDVIVGWAGTQPDEDLSQLESVLAELCRLRPRVVIRVVSRHPFAFTDQAVRQEWQPWSADQQYGYLAAFDVGIMPLRDSPYNRAKESYKLKEYMASGLAVLASPVGHNTRTIENGADGLLAADDQEWLAVLLRLIDSPDERRLLGQHARQTALRRWDTAALDPYVQHLEALIGGTGT